MDNFINQIFFIVIFNGIAIGLSIHVFNNYILRIPIYITIGISICAFIFGSIFNFFMINNIAILGTFYTLSIIFLEFGLDEEKNVKRKFFNRFLLIERDHIDKTNINVRNIIKSQWNKNVILFFAIFSAEQIIAYKAKNTFFEYAVSSRYKFEITSSSLVIPIIVTLFYYFGVKLYRKIALKNNIDIIAK